MAVKTAMPRDSACKEPIYAVPVSVPVGNGPETSPYAVPVSVGSGPETSPYAVPVSVRSGPETSPYAVPVSVGSGLKMSPYAVSKPLMTRAVGGGKASSDAEPFQVPVGMSQVYPPQTKTIEHAGADRDAAVPVGANAKASPAATSDYARPRDIMNRAVIESARPSRGAATRTVIRRAAIYFSKRLAARTARVAHMVRHAIAPIMQQLQASANEGTNNQRLRTKLGEWLTRSLSRAFEASKAILRSIADYWGR